MEPGSTRLLVSVGMRSSFVPRVEAPYELTKTHQAAVGEVMRRKMSLSVLVIMGTREDVPGQEVVTNVFVGKPHHLKLLGQFISIGNTHFNVIGENWTQSVLFGKKNQIPFKRRKLGDSDMLKRHILDLLGEATIKRSQNLANLWAAATLLLLSCTRTIAEAEAPLIRNRFQRLAQLVTDPRAPQYT